MRDSESYSILAAAWSAFAGSASISLSVEPNVTLPPSNPKGVRIDNESKGMKEIFFQQISKEDEKESIVADGGEDNQSGNNGVAQAGEEKTFKPFPRLPEELRNKIWGHALADIADVPRFINITTSYQHPGEGSKINGNAKFWAPRCTEGLSLLYVNKEARLEVSKIYKELKGSEPASDICYFNPDIDYLCLTMVNSLGYRVVVGMDEFFNSLPDETIRMIKNIAMDKDDWYTMWSKYWRVFRPRPDGMYDTLAVRMNLKSIALGIRPGLSDNDIIGFHEVKGCGGFSLGRARIQIEDMLSRAKSQHPEWQVPQLILGKFVCTMLSKAKIEQPKKDRHQGFERGFRQLAISDN